MRPFETRVSGKWVLSGEHAVLRGVPAIALPHPELSLRLRFEPAEGGLDVHPSEAAPLLRELLGAIPGLPAISGRLSIESAIPQGAGLGSSAALCVALTQWLSEPLRLAPAERIEFATRLEDRFHGKSSGMDVAAIAAGAPVRYVRGHGAQALGIGRLPRFAFLDTGLRARTRDCVAQVAAFAQARPDEALRLDQRMVEASGEAEGGLRDFDRGETARGLERVARAMELGHRCFEAWGLVPPQAQALRQRLLAEGALSARLTGAGGGGMVVALWGQ